MGPAHMTCMTTIAPETVDEQDPVARFAADTAEHRMLVLLDTPDHLHLRFMSPSSSTYWFEVVTWGHTLAYTGDMGDYLFRWPGEQKVFGFFNRTEPHYLSTKVVAGKVKEYSEAQAREVIADALRDAAEYDYGNQSLTAALDDGSLAADLISAAGSEETMRAAMREAEEEFDGAVFSDSWEHDLTDYTFRFRWALAAINHALESYRTYRSRMGAAA